MSEAHEELLNVYDATGRVIATRRRRDAKASGEAVGAVNALIATGSGEVLLQRRPEDKENGGLWDKSVGGHVSAGEDFDQTLLREASEELFDEPASGRLRLAGAQEELLDLVRSVDLRETVVLRRAELRLNLRDVRHAPGRAGIRNVLYHVGIYLGRTEIPLGAFRPQASEIVALRYLPAAEVDRLLLEGALAANMAFLWLAQGEALLRLARG